MTILMGKSPFTNWAQEHYPNKILVFSAIEGIHEKCSLRIPDETLQLISERLEFYSPVLQRHVPTRNLNRTNELLVEAIASALIHLDLNEVTYAIFETSAAHHIDNVVLEIVCDLQDIEKIFLSHTSFTLGLLPIAQKVSVDTRKPIMTGIFEENCQTIDLDLAGENWQRRISMSKSDEVSLFKFLLKLFFARLFRNFMKIKCVFSRDKHCRSQSVDEYVERFYGYNFFDDVKVALSQRIALRYFKILSRSKLMRKRAEEVEEANLPRIILHAHYQPEVSSFPLGYPFHDQLFLVQTLMQIFPKSKIVYREHPHISRLMVHGAPTRVGISRCPKYYWQLYKWGCIFPAKQNDFLRSESDSDVNVTLTGKIAIERALSGKQSLIFGNPWYKGCPNVVHYQDPNYIGSLFSQADCSQAAETWIKELLCCNLVATPPWSHITSLEKSNEFLVYNQDLIKLIDFLESDYALSDVYIKNQL